MLYGTDLNRVDDAASSFYVTPASIPGYGNLATYQAMVAQANAWLATAANSPLAPLLGSTFWQTTDADGNPTTDNQDLIGPTGFVPEPATFLAGLLAGSYLVWHTIRRRG